MHDRDVIDLLVEILIAGRGGGAVDISKPPFTDFRHVTQGREVARSLSRGRSSPSKRRLVTDLAPKKRKRRVSPYQREFGRQLKALKKKHPRTPIGTLMKKAHTKTRRAMK